MADEPELRKMHTCSYLLPPPGGEVVRGLIADLLTERGVSMDLRRRIAEMDADLKAAMDMAATAILKGSQVDAERDEARDRVRQMEHSAAAAVHSILRMEGRILPPGGVFMGAARIVSFLLLGCEPEKVPPVDD